MYSRGLNTVIANRWILEFRGRGLYQCAIGLEVECSRVLG